MTKDQEERQVLAWESIAKGLGDLNETFRAAIGKQWPEAREPREAVISRVPTAEDKLKKETGNTTGPIEEWLGEFASEEEIGPREREFLEQQGRQAKFVARPKAPVKARKPRAAGTKAPRS